MHIPISKLNYTFRNKPLLVGGKAMEYYGIRKAGTDIDFIADEQDVIELIKMYPTKVKSLYYDLGICPFEFEIWRTILFFDYHELKVGAIEKKDYLVLSLEKLLMMKSLGIEKEKYLNDTKLITKKIIDNKYKNFEDEKKHIQDLLSGIKGIVYIEKTEPTS